MTPNNEARQRRGRYALTGAAIGLYFGLFFQPVRQPSLLFIIGLSFVIAIATVLVRLFRSPRPSTAALARTAVLTFARYAFILAIFEARHFAYDFGGRWATALLTTGAGLIAGYWFAADATRSTQGRRKS